MLPILVHTDPCGSPPLHFLGQIFFNPHKLSIKPSLLTVVDQSCNCLKWAPIAQSYTHRTNMGNSESYKIKNKSVKKSRLVPWWLSSKATSSARAVGSIPGSGRSPGGGNGNALQCSCLENSGDRGAWRTTAHGVAELDMTEHMHTHTIYSQSYFFWRI